LTLLPLRGINFVHLGADNYKKRRSV
jgi:hypothetical protein